jgi:hypothetical protein
MPCGLCPTVCAEVNDVANPRERVYSPSSFLEKTLLGVV